MLLAACGSREWSKVPVLLFLPNSTRLGASTYTSHKNGGRLAADEVCQLFWFVMTEILDGHGTNLTVMSAIRANTGHAHKDVRPKDPSNSTVTVLCPCLHAPGVQAALTCSFSNQLTADYVQRFSETALHHGLAGTCYNPLSNNKILGPTYDVGQAPSPWQTPASRPPPSPFLGRPRDV